MDKRKAVRKEKEGAFVDMLNQEMKELQEGMKQKQIEEMARDICGNFGVKIENLCGPLDFKCDCKCKWFDIAERFYNAGYRKIPEGAVVLTEEESVKAWENGNCNAHAIYGLAYEQARKETAEKFAERVKMAFYYEFDELIPSIMADKIDEICKEITEGNYESKI